MKSVSRTLTGQRIAFAVIAGLFVIWGLALWLYNALFFMFANSFAFEPVQVAWALSLYSIAYCLLAIPAALIHRRFGYKLGLLFGFNVFVFGAFLLYLAIIQNSIACFLGAIVMMGSCGTLFDTSLNPLAVEAGSPQTSVARLNLAHVFNGFGLLVAYFAVIWLTERNYHLSPGAEAHSSLRPYVLIGLAAILLAYLFEQVSLPGFAANPTERASDIRGELRSLFRDRNFLIAATSLCAYTIVLTILWTSNYNYRVHELPGHSVGLIERGPIWFVIGRCVGTAFMRWIDPTRLLQWTTGLCLIAIAITAAAGGMVGWVCLLSASLFLSIMFPTVFGSAICRHRTRMKLAAGVLVAAAGFGNALSALFVALALHALHIDARIVILLALPFLAIILIYSLVQHSGHKRARNTEQHAVTQANEILI
ncbi:MAG: MFS transporter [Rhizomicrobium sp.]